jgi:hypothetical protein
VTVIKTTSGCGCLTVLAVVVVLFGPAWFPLPLAIVAYVVLGVVAVLGGVGWILRRKGQAAPPMPPPAPAPPPL